MLKEDDVHVPPENALQLQNEKWEKEARIYEAELGHIHAPVPQRPPRHLAQLLSEKKKSMYNNPIMPPKLEPLEGSLFQKLAPETIAIWEWAEDGFKEAAFPGTSTTSEVVKLLRNALHTNMACPTISELLWSQSQPTHETLAATVDMVAQLTALNHCAETLYPADNPRRYSIGLMWDHVVIRTLRLLREWEATLPQEHLLQFYSCNPDDACKEDSKLHHGAIEVVLRGLCAFIKSLWIIERPPFTESSDDSWRPKLLSYGLAGNAPHADPEIDFDEKMPGTWHIDLNSIQVARLAFANPLITPQFDLDRYSALGAKYGDLRCYHLGDELMIDIIIDELEDNGNSETGAYGLDLIIKCVAAGWNPLMVSKSLKTTACERLLYCAIDYPDCNAQRICAWACQQLRAAEAGYGAAVLQRLKLQALLGGSASRSGASRPACHPDLFKMIESELA
jgi:hypothetical protein